MVRSVQTAFLFILFFVRLPAQQHFPLLHQIKDPVPPVQLTGDTSTLYLTDFFVYPEKIDSISLPNVFHYKWNKKESTVLVLATNSSVPLLSEMKLWSGGYAYSVLLKKSMKQTYEIEFDPKGVVDTSVQLAGEMNDWTPKRTNLVLKEGNWRGTLTLNPGTYQYQLVENGKWHLDHANPDSVDNNNGGYNSVFRSGKILDPDRPVLQTQKILSKAFTFSGTNEPEYFVYWQNFRLGDDYVIQSEHEVTVKIPAEAKNYQRSFIRVYALNQAGTASDLLIPLQFDEVLNNASQISRNDKQADIIYFVLVDRFKDGDPSNNHPVVNPQLKPKANYYGGDLQGIVQKIKDGYLESLNVNTIWISPILLNPATAFREFPEPRDLYSGYHGYWPISLTQIDYRFGNDKVFSELVQETHLQKMNVIMDLVANHVHEDYPLIKKHPEWRTQLDLPDGRKNIRIWDECRLTTWFDTFLPTLDFSKPEVVKLQVDSSAYWIRKFGLDGFRHDATKHIPENFWRALSLELKKDFVLKQNKCLYQIGETYGSRELINSYIGSGMMDGQFDFNLYFDARSVFAKDSTPFTQAVNSLLLSLNYFGSHHLMGNISGNHDIPRFASLAGGGLSFNEDPRKAGWQRDVKVGNPIAYKKMALLECFNATIPGVPVIYYGDEIGMPGAGDPDNRRMMRFANLSADETQLKAITAKLFGIRRSHLSLLYGDFKILKQEAKVFAYSRTYFNETTVVILNNSNQTKDILLNVGAAAKEFTPQFSNSIIITANNIKVTLPPKSFELLIGKK